MTAVPIVAGPRARGRHHPEYLEALRRDEAITTAAELRKFIGPLLHDSTGLMPFRVKHQVEIGVGRFTPAWRRKLSGLGNAIARIRSKVSRGNPRAVGTASVAGDLKLLPEDATHLAVKTDEGHVEFTATRLARKDADGNKAELSTNIILSEHLIASAAASTATRDQAAVQAVLGVCRAAIHAQLQAAAPQLDVWQTMTPRTRASVTAAYVELMSHDAAIRCLAKNGTPAQQTYLGEVMHERGERFMSGAYGKRRADAYRVLRELQWTGTPPQGMRLLQGFDELQRDPAESVDTWLWRSARLVEAQQAERRARIATSVKNSEAEQRFVLREPITDADLAREAARRGIVADPPAELIAEINKVLPQRVLHTVAVDPPARTLPRRGRPTTPDRRMTGGPTVVPTSPIESVLAGRLAPSGSGA